MHGACLTGSHILPWIPWLAGRRKSTRTKRPKATFWSSTNQTLTKSPAPSRGKPQCWQAAARGVAWECACGGARGAGWALNHTCVPPTGRRPPTAAGAGAAAPRTHAPTHPHATANNGRRRVRNQETVGLQAVGPQSVYNTVKALSLAKSYLKKDEIDLRFTPAWTTSDDERQTTGACHTRFAPSAPSTPRVGQRPAVVAWA